LEFFDWLCHTAISTGECNTLSLVANVDWQQHFHSYIDIGETKSWLIRILGMETCPGKVIAETEAEVWKLVELHAKIAHDEDANAWDEDTRKYIKTLIKPV